jgi:hypothetical protein
MGSAGWNTHGGWKVTTSEWKPVDYRKSAIKYAALTALPAAMGILTASQDLDGNDFAGVFLILAVPIAVPQFLYSLVLSLRHLFHQAFAASAWYLAMGFSGIIVSIGPIYLVEYTHLIRP